MLKHKTITEKIALETLFKDFTAGELFTRAFNYKFPQKKTQNN